MLKNRLWTDFGQIYKNSDLLVSIHPVMKLGFVFKEPQNIYSHFLKSKDQQAAELMEKAFTMDVKKAKKKVK